MQETVREAVDTYCVAKWNAENPLILLGHGYKLLCQVCVCYCLSLNPQYSSEKQYTCQRVLVALRCLFESSRNKQEGARRSCSLKTSSEIPMAIAIWTLFFELRLNSHPPCSKKNPACHATMKDPKSRIMRLKASVAPKISKLQASVGALGPSTALLCCSSKRAYGCIWDVCQHWPRWF